MEYIWWWCAQSMHFEKNMSIDLVYDVLKCSIIVRVCLANKFEMSNRSIVSDLNLYLRYGQIAQHISIGICECDN